MRKASNWFIMLLLLLAFGGILAFAQANSELTGIVTDQTGAVVPGCEDLTLTDPATGFTKVDNQRRDGLV